MTIRRRLINAIQMLDIWPSSVRTRLLRWAGIDIHPTARVMAYVHVSKGSLSIGEGAFINFRCMIEPSGGIRIGDGVSIGPGASIISGSHEIGYPRRAAAVIGDAVSVGSGTWIGANATVLPGALIAERVVIAAGAVVSKAEQPDTLYAGVPARPVRALTGTSAEYSMPDTARVPNRSAAG